MPEKKQIERIYSLSPMQEGMLYHSLIDENSSAYFEQFCIKIEGKLDIRFFESSFNEIIKRYEVLRTIFIYEKIKSPKQVVIKSYKTKIHFEDISRFINEKKEEHIKKFRKKEIKKGFDLAKGGLVRLAIFKTDDSRYILIWSFHHIIMDGWCLGILFRDLINIYFSLKKEIPIQLQPTVPYRNFIQWLRRQDKSQATSYWKKYLEEYDHQDLLNRHEEKTDEGDYRLEEYYFNFNESLALKISQMAKESQTTINMVMQAIWGLVLQKLNNVDDVIFGTVVSGRPSELDGIEDMVGLFMNTIPTRVKCKDLIFFSELLESIKENSINMRPYEYLSLAEIQALSLMSNRLIDHLMVFENYPIQQEMENIGLDKKIGFKIEDIDTFEHTPYNFNIIIAPGDQILVKYSYNSLAYSSEFIRKIASYFENIILQIADSPKIKLENIELLNKNERNEILAISKGRIELSSLGETLPQIFEERAVQFKEKIALQFNDHQLTYDELNIRANQLARYLSDIGVGVNTIVALMMDRSLEMIISIIAILKVGGGYLPIDPHYPKERIKAVLKDSAATFILTKKNISKCFSYTLLNKIDELDLTPFVTHPREQISHFDYLPKPDRSLVDYQKYHENIGIAMIQKSISLQATRGCPFNCAFCHKIWPKKHVVRSAENIFEEIELNDKRGIKKFVFIDDIFNLHHENSSRLMRKIISEKLNVQLFFPNGLRGDILTKDAVDLMIEAGTVNIDLALESASPRIQKLINKNLHLEKFRENIEYIINKYPNILLEMELMIGFPTETEDEALMTLDFLNDLKWIHFPNLNILKIYPNTDMYDLALGSGISKKHVERSINLAYHELPDTLPFSKAFVSQYQFQFMNEYFLSKQRLKHVLPFQMNLLSESELVQKYNSYLPMEIKSFQGLLHTVKLDESDLENKRCRDDDPDLSQRYIQELQLYSKKRKMDKKDAFRILLIDLSLSFSDEKENRLYDMVEEPLGLMYLMTYLNQEFKEKIHGKVVKSRIDFDSYKDLKTLINTFNPDLIGIRTLSFYKDFFHRTAAKIKGWGIQAPVIAGGPYATSDFSILLQDSYVDLVVLGEGEITLAELVKGMMANQNQIPPEDELKNIRGIAFIETNKKGWLKQAKPRVIEWENISILLEQYPTKNLVISIQPENLAYIMYTSGSTGIPKGVMLEHKNLVNLIDFDFKYTSLDFSKILQFHTIGFDASFHEIFSALLSGGKLYLIDEATTTNVPELFDIVEKNRIPTLFLPTSFLRSIFNEEDFIKHFPSCVVHVQTAGEQLVISDTYRECLKLHQLTLHNHYGPAETHVVTTLTLSHNDPIPEIPAIGKPIQNSDIFILDKDFHFLPIGAPGELFIGGIQVGRGYLNKVEFTSGRFVKDLFNDNNRTYRTGDLAKYLPDGSIDFLGRIDRQIKIRGFRVEPGEIENILLGIDFIKDVGVIDRKDVSGEKYLCAYIVTEQNVNLSELKGILLKSLPDYMIPSLFVPMVKLPLTPSGKVDIKALPEPEIKGIRKKYRVPISEMEKTLRDIWSDVLGIEKETLSIEENFFDLGGHSLKAIILSSRICKELNLKITLSELFKNATIKEMAEFLKNAKKEEYISIAAIEKKEYYQLSSGQKRLFILQQMETENISYNIPGVFILEGEISKEKLEEVFKQLINRHESFRTSFDMINGKPVQKIYDEVEFTIKYYKSEGIGHEVWAPIIEDTIQGFIRPFDLSHAPLIRVGLIKLNETRYIIMLDMHHIITDGISMDIFIKEFMTLYERGKLSKLKIQYKDYSEMQNSKEEGEIIKKQEEFWLKEFKGEVNVLNLPTDYTRPTIQSFEGDTIFFEIGLEKTKALKRLAEEEEATLFIVLFAIFNIFLWRISNQEEIVIGTPIANRRHADLEHIIGMFVNTLALKNFPSGEKRFTNFLKEVRENVFTAFENQDFQFEELVEKVEINRDASRNPLFDVTFVLQNMEISEIKIPGLKLKPYQLKNMISKFDLSFLVVENDEELSFSVEYSTKLFRKETIERFILNFKNIICSVVEDPGVRICDIEIVSEEEKQQILYEFNDTAVDYPRDKTVHWLFEEQVKKTPDNVAVVFEEQRLTYRVLNEISNQLARLLRKKGVKENTIIGISVERSLEMIIGILGIIKSGGGYLPIEPQYPDERKKYMIEDSGAKILISDSDNLTNYEVDHLVDINDKWIDFGDKSNPENINKSSDIVYVIYTSGTTGLPKGAILEHGSIINTLLCRKKEYKMNSEDVSLQLFSYSFDGFVTSFFTPIISGSRVIQLNKDEIIDPLKIKEVIIKDRVTHFISVPALYSVILENLTKKDSVLLKAITLAGDKLLPNLIDKSREKYRDVEIVNEYGVTETSVMSTIYRNQEKSEIISIGKPIGNTKIYIMSNNMHLQPIGIVGEMVIAGTGVSKGYLNNSFLSRERFIENPYIKNEQMYRTGDLARWLPGGNIEFLGRIDSQTKIRGFRIELGEIESYLLKLEGIKEAVVIERDSGKGDKYLCGYLVLEKEKSLNIKDTRDKLSRYLPGYMIPSYFVNLDKIPLTPSGKIDRKALPNPEIKRGEDYIAPRNEMEEQLVEICSEVLGVDKNKISIDANFFELGGHSLSATILISKIHKKLNIIIPLGILFKSPTMEKLSEFALNAKQDKFEPMNSVEKKEYYSLSSTQKRFFIMHQLNPSSIAYNVSMNIFIKGDIDKKIIEESFKKIIKRHEILRSTFEFINEEPVQRIFSEFNFDIEYYCSSNKDVDEIIRNFIRPFDFTKKPLIQVGLTAMDRNDWLLMLDLPHIALDAFSINILIEELKFLYRREELPGLKLQYKDFAEWQKKMEGTEIMKKQECFWLKEFEQEIQVINLPIDFKRPSIQSFEGSLVEFEFDVEISGALKEMSLRENTTLYMIIFTIFNIFLSKITGQEDIIIGTGIPGRRHMDLEYSIGPFLYTLALRNYPKGEKTFSAFLKEVNKRRIQAMENQDYQFFDLVEKVAIEREPGRNPLFDVGFEFLIQTQPFKSVSEENVRGLKFKSYDYDYNVSKLDLGLGGAQINDKIFLSFEYNTKLFKKEKIESFVNYFKGITLAIIKNKEIYLKDIDIFQNLVKAQSNVLGVDKKEFAF